MTQIIICIHLIQSDIFLYMLRNLKATCEFLYFFLSRYCIERVFRPRKLDRAHPRELVECAFDIITPVTNSLLPDAETIYTISEIVQEFPALQVVKFVLRSRSVHGLNRRSSIFPTNVISSA